MSEPTTDDLQHAFAVLVGDPRPPLDLAHRARVRGTTLRRQRMAGGLTAVAVLGTLSVPAAIFVRDAGQGRLTGSVAGQPTAGQPTAGQPKDAASPSGLAAKRQQADAATADKLKASALAANKPAGVDGVGPTPQTVLKEGVPTALDNQRVAAAKALLPNGFTAEATQVAVDATSGVRRGAAVSFSSAGGATVGIEWSTGEHSITGSSATATLGPKDGANAKDSSVSGAVLVVGDTEWDLKILQGPPGSSPVLSTGDEALAFLHHLAGA